MRPVIRRRPREGVVYCHRFPVSFRLPPLACRAVLYPPRISASLTVGLPTAGHLPLDPDGISMFRTDKIRPVSGAPYTPGPWCSHGRWSDISHHCHLSVAGPVPRFCFPSPGVEVSRLAGVHVIHPSGLPFACNQRMEHRSLGFLPGSTPRRYQRRMPGAGTSVEHSLGTNRR
jgi:hypothetical protein